MVSVWQVAVYALVTALATGVGAVPFVFTRQFAKRWLGLARALAAGLMLGASFGLIYEGFADGEATWRTLGGVVGGLAFIVLAYSRLRRDPEREFAGLQRLDAIKALMIVAVITVHSFAEGVGVGVAFGDGRELGVLIAAAIAVQNVPEGLAIALVMVPRGATVGSAAVWSVISSLPQPLMAVPAFVFVETFEAWLPVGLGFAAGAMIWMVFSELLPDALEDASHNEVGVTATLSLVAMQAIQILIG